VRSPLRATDREIQQIVERRRAWIEPKQRVARERYRKVSERSFREGDRYPYLGVWYPLFIIDSPDGKAPLRFCGGRFHLHREHLHRARELMTAWYQEQARRILPERTILYASKTGLSYEKVRITDARKRWGSCSSSGNINLAWRLVMAPLEIIDYVIVHELSHREEQNHSSRFWEQVARIIPEYRSRRGWLNEHGFLLNL